MTILACGKYIRSTLNACGQRIYGKYFKQAYSPKCYLAGMCKQSLRLVDD